MGSRSPSFAAVAGALGDLPAALRIMRQSRRLSLREVADQCGVSFNALSRLERGGDCSLDNAKAILLWLDTSPTATEERAP